MNGHPYAYKLTIEIPDQDMVTRRGIETTGIVHLSCEGIATVPDGITSDQVREYVVNEVAKDHLGKTVTITQWEMVPAVQEGGPR
ncbi:hypothetical protein [Micromonospora peucetia]|uniref:YKOF-related Family n=1 Tax=Micromonospora peucetia TaxID=47871 RepID=A0ABZ1EJY0_9ACTN|nr:hypothetical protein [Micromonospora peucetia]WSA34572.1 hypothetical protein OIE14_11260 [Micromonospora peucetia]